MTISFDDFEKIDIRVGTIIEAEIFPEARKPAFHQAYECHPSAACRSRHQHNSGVARACFG